MVGLHPSGDEIGDLIEDLIREATDVQHVLAVHGLRGAIGLDLDADQFRRPVAGLDAVACPP